MTEHRRALRAARPVLAGAVLAGGKCGAVGLRSRQRVMAVRRIAAAVGDLALLRQRGLFCQIVGAVQLGDVLGDDNAFCVLPRPLADAIARIDRGLAVDGLGREIGAPGFCSGASGLRQRLAGVVGTRETAEIGAVANARRGDKETGGGRLRLRRWRCEKRQRRGKPKNAKGNVASESGHRVLRFVR